METHDEKGRFTKGHGYWTGHERDSQTNQKIASTLRQKVVSGQTASIGGKRLWTPQEIDLLKEHYPKWEIDELVKMLGRTRLSITNKAEHLGIHCNGIKPTNTKKFSEFDLGYLAAMLEGEGSIFIKRAGKYFVPCVSVTTNMDEGIIDHVTNVLSNAGFRAYRKADHRSAYDGRTCWQVEIVGHVYVYPFLERIRPYIQGKKNEIAGLLMDYCKSRVQNKGYPYHPKPYTPTELELISRIRALNSRKGKVM